MSMAGNRAINIYKKFFLVKIALALTPFHWFSGLCVDTPTISEDGKRTSCSHNVAAKTKEDGVKNHEQQLEDVKAQVYL